MRLKANGFTLIELMIVIAIVAILVMIAIPSYEKFITKSRRVDGQSSLMDLAVHMERYFTQNNTYTGATLANMAVAAASPESHYTLAINNANAAGYAIQAAPQGVQASKDTLCGTLTLDNLGQKGQTGAGATSDCW